MTTAQAFLIIVGVLLILASYIPSVPTFPLGVAACFFALGLPAVASLSG